MQGTATWPAAARALGGLSARRRFAAAVAAGVAAALAQPPTGLWPLLFLAGPALFWLWRPTGGRGAFAVGWGYGLGFFGAGLHWIVEPFLVDAATWGWAAPFAIVAVAAGFALFPGVAFWGARRLAGDGGPVTQGAALVLCWGLSEGARSYILTGFPWALPVYAWVETPVAQVAALIGPYALSLMILAATVAPALSAGPGWRRFAPAGAAALAVAAAWGWGAARPPAAAPAGETVVRIVQPNIPQTVKWELGLTRAHLETTMALTRAPAEGAPPDIVIWPESAVTFPIDLAGDARKEIAIAAGGAEVVLGSLRGADGPESVYQPNAMWRNSIFILGPGGALSAPYDKAHLVPFGEYFPFDATLKRLGISAIASSGGGLQAGPGPVVMRPDRAPPFAPMICYEMVFPRETQAAAEGAEWMVLVTNDAWFGDWAGPEQHLAHARMRAIETGLAIARSANTGVSAMIDPYGRPLRRLDLGLRGFADHRLPLPLDPPPYRRFGEFFTALLALLMISPLSIRYFRR